MLRFFDLKQAKSIILLGAPIILVRLLYILVNVIGMVMIAQLGQLSVAASTLIAALLNTLIVIAMSPFLSVGIIVSRYVGANTPLKIGNVMCASWFVSILISSIAMIFCWNISSVLVFFRQPEVLIPLIQPYFYIASWGILPMLLMANCHQLCFAVKKSQLVLYLGVATLMLTIPLGTCLIYGYLGAPKLGMLGWAYAVSGTNWVMAIVAIMRVSLAHDFKAFQILKFNPHLVLNEIFHIFKIGGPIVTQFASELLAFSLLNLMVGWLGTTTLSIQQIVLQTTAIALMLPMGGAQASSILIGKAIGEKKNEEVSTICVTSIILMLLCMCLIIFLYIVFSDNIINLYLELPKTSPQFKLAKLILIIAGFSQAADGIRNVIIGCLRGLQDMKWPMLVNTIMVFSALPFAYLLGFVLNSGLVGINLSFMICFFIGAMLMSRRLIKTVDSYVRERE